MGTGRMGLCARSRSGTARIREDSVSPRRSNSTKLSLQGDGTRNRSKSAVGCWRKSF